MRKSDIIMGSVVMANERTESLYVPVRVPAKEMTAEQAARGLCAKSGGKVTVCKACPAPCAFGRRMIELEGT